LLLVVRLWRSAGPLWVGVVLPDMVMMTSSVRKPSGQLQAALWDY
jgi:hypothetical protein